MTTTEVTQEVELVGHVSVDSGQVMIVDPCYVLDGEYDEAPENDPKDHKVATYGHPCAVTLSDKRHGEFVAKGYATAVASSSGYGDGHYPVYAVKDDDGRVVEMTIYFDEDPHTGERSMAAEMMAGYKAQNDPAVRKIMDYMVDYDDDGQPEGMTTEAFAAGFTADDVIRLQEIFTKAAR
tara:strand:+ start:663 stop:1202 length:540 start_codon:yes stop_codon:yes gene_type:complete